MTAWRNVTEAELQKRGLLPEKTVAPTPVRRRVAPRSNGGQVGNILGVALQEAFPGVFMPHPALGITWGNATLKLGIVWGGVVRTDDNADWRIMPVWWHDLHTEQGTWSDRKLTAVVKRIGEALKVGEQCQANSTTTAIHASARSSGKNRARDVSS